MGEKEIVFTASKSEKIYIEICWPHLTCLFLLSCVVPEPIYGHLIDSIGTGWFQ